MLKAMFNGGEESKARMEGGGHDKEVDSSEFQYEYTKIDTLFMTKVAAKWPKSIPYLWAKRLKNLTLWGRTYLYSPYKGVPPGGNY